MQMSAHLEGVASLCLAVYHFHYVLVDFLSVRIPLRPIVTRSPSILPFEDVFWVI